MYMEVVNLCIGLTNRKRCGNNSRPRQEKYATPNPYNVFHRTQNLSI